MTGRVAQLARLFDHLAWADAALASALARPDAPAEAIREFAHVAGADEVWLSRIEGRPATTKVWPELGASEAADLSRRVVEGFRHVVAAATDASLEKTVTYTNSAGQQFTTALGDILIHVAMHAQYHRGKVNLLLRQAGAEPAPVDFIGFVRGVPAAVTPR